MSSPTVLITGASRGLGAVLATLWAGDGARVVMTARGADELAATAAAIRADGGTVNDVAGDIADPEHRRRLVAEVGGRLDVLVHNASTLGPSPLPRLLKVDSDAIRRVMEVNVVAPLALTRASRAALAAGDGLVVHVSSDAAHGGYEGWGVYGMSKIALELAARTLSAEEPWLTPVIVDPGDMRTAMQQDAFPGDDISDRPPPVVTVPFWRWLFAQDRDALRGRRFEAQGDLWPLPAAQAASTGRGA